MARGTQLLDLIAQLRAETGHTQNIAVGLDQLENLKKILVRHQALLYDQYDWPHMNVERTISLSAGQRYYDLPSDLDFDRLTDIKLKYNNVYTDLERSIDFDDYSIFDSNNDERSSPTLKWDIRNTGTKEQLEVWPIPNNNVDKIYFRGTKVLGDLIQEADTADLDDHLIVLFAAAETLKRQKSGDANDKMAAANARLLKLRANSLKKSKTIQVGLGNNMLDQSNRVKTRIIVS